MNTDMQKACQKTHLNLGSIRSNLVDVNIAVHHRIDGERANASQTQFLHDVFPMGHNGGKPDVQLVGYLLIDVALHNEYHHLGLTIAQDGLLVGVCGHYGQVLPSSVRMLLQCNERVWRCKCN